MTYSLRPLNGAEDDWVKTREPPPQSSQESPQHGISASESYDLVSLPADEDDAAILLEAHRELRIKLFMGEVVHLLYIQGRQHTHLLFTGCSRMGVAHTRIPHFARCPDVQSGPFQR